MEKNSPDVWNRFFSSFSESEATHSLEQARKSILWKRIRDHLLGQFLSLDGLSTVEVGAGIGTYSLLLAEHGTKPTLLDYSDEALAIARRIFSSRGTRATFVPADALALPNHLIGQFDIAMSFGVTEHFLGQERFQINAAHFDLLRPGGVALIAVPNALNPPYRIAKLAAELLGKWRVGEEYPYSRMEFVRIAKKLGVKEYRFLGDSLVASFTFFFSPRRILAQVLPLRMKNTSRRPAIREQSGTCLDEHFSYLLVFCGKKPDGTKAN